MENQKTTCENTGMMMSWFMAGACVGAAVALIAAPNSGRTTRRLLREKADEGADLVLDAGRESYRKGVRLAKDGADLLNRASHVMAR